MHVNRQASHLLERVRERGREGGMKSGYTPLDTLASPQPSERGGKDMQFTPKLSGRWRRASAEVPGASLSPALSVAHSEEADKSPLAQSALESPVP